MIPYAELVRKAKEMHKKLNENKFQELYEKSPASLIKDMGVHIGQPGTTGIKVLQAFPFYPLQERNEGVYKKILKNVGKHPLHIRTLSPAGKKAIHMPETLRILEARGLVKTKVMAFEKSALLVVTDVFDGREWRKALLPEGARVAR